MNPSHSARLVNFLLEAASSPFLICPFNGHPHILLLSFALFVGSFRGFVGESGFVISLDLVFNLSRWRASSLAIWRNPRPVFDRFHKTPQFDRTRTLTARLHVVRDTGTKGDGGSKVAAFAAASASSLPTVPMCAGIHRLVIWISGCTSIAARTRTSYAIARN